MPDVPPSKYPVAIQGGSISPSDNWVNQMSDTDYIDEAVVLLDTATVTGSSTSDITFTSNLYGQNDWRRYEQLRWVWYADIDNSYGTGIDYTYIAAQLGPYPTSTPYSANYGTMMYGRNPNTGGEVWNAALAGPAIYCGILSRDTSYRGNCVIMDFYTGHGMNKQGSLASLAGGKEAGGVATGSVAITTPEPIMIARFICYVQTGTLTTFAVGTTVSMYGFFGNDGGTGDWE
tara:strand:+ start:25 stop:720 length:696 start_codon:yes stop_codon:yes gene_type:complete